MPGHPLLGQGDDDALGAAAVTQPMAVLAKAVDADAGVVHPLDRHARERGRSTVAAQGRGSVKVLAQPPTAGCLVVVARDRSGIVVAPVTARPVRRIALAGP